MGFLDRLLGRDEPQYAAPAPPRAPGRQLSEDELAVERYRYLLRTAPPEAVEQAHNEAFSKLTPEQRRLVYRRLSEEAAAGDAPTSDQPEDLARSATRSELREPGSMERAFSDRGQNGPSFGQMFGSSMLGTIAGFVIGSAIANAFLPDASAFDAGATDAGAADASTEAGGDWGGDAGGFDGGGLGDFGDFGF
ncbi:hypothetical protein ARHIZOSPH14_29390 [Agromyces rhizosphaerae]|uniref:DUF2076 domain-containing protein n=1 Tax=Agromyces rhizosphaerae TaxID=88374 RepID=A0A9W6FSF7_9MICO|nr:hypothetical protein [Agromyces rhizosphaerae]GLI28697.1 hypothetical protein ARHIZOSPH14_29390 [Agromyces rhizosphaerae]